MVIKILTFLHLVNGIVLEDYNGEWYYTIKQKSPFDNTFYARIYFWTNVGKVTLNDDGTVSNSYVQKWTPIRKKKFNPIKEAQKILERT